MSNIYEIFMNDRGLRVDRTNIPTLAIIDIATEEKAELKRLVDFLWNAGFFLSYWVTAIQNYSEVVNSFVVNITSQILTSAADSRLNGERAMNYLRESEKAL